MLTMSYIRRAITTLVLGCFAAFLGACLLVQLGAPLGWFYGLGISVNTVVTYRILVPALGQPSVRPRIWRRRNEEKRLPRPIH